ncbi:class F sortase [Agromyces sp. NPDC058484]|uniref:class F sortase n=1 Tax=Agromyces sp. NPDC058484 TaxID=3346524 RepID=UPI00364AA205
MSHHSTGRQLRLPAGMVALLLLLTGCALSDQQEPSSPPAASSAPSPDPAPAEPDQTPSPAAEPQQDLPPSVALAMEPSEPVSLRIPAVNIDSGLMKTGLRADNTLEVPPNDDGSPASWYNGSATPGSAGVSVLLGHVNSLTDATGVFYDLRHLQPGDQISVARADGATAVFEVYKNETYVKDEFPTKAIYYPVPGAEIRLITCDAYDGDNLLYANNLVVYAKLVGVA